MHHIRVQKVSASRFCIAALETDTLLLFSAVCDMASAVVTSAYFTSIS
jgi:hypothetical protein